MADQKKEEQWRWADNKARRVLPRGVKLIRTLRGHKDMIGRIAWSPDGRMLASPSSDKTIRLWDAETGKCLRIIEGDRSALSIAFDPSGQILASGNTCGTVRLWDTNSGKILRRMEGHQESARSVIFIKDGHNLASGSHRDIKLWDTKSGRLICILKGHSNWISNLEFDASNRTLISGSDDRTIKIWDVISNRLLRSLYGHNGWVFGISFDPKSCMIASGSGDRTVKIWESASGKLIRTLEGHTGKVWDAKYLCDGQILISKSGDGTIRIWNPKIGSCLVEITEPTRSSKFGPGLATHPHLPIFAVVGSDYVTQEYERMESSFRDRVIHIYELDLTILLGQLAEPIAQYVNAKVVLVGDTGVGKTGLSLVLSNQTYKETDSTAGRHVWTFDSREINVGKNITQTRETLLWDLAGQPGYRVIHQLHLNEVAVALVVFDARSETDPLAGVRHWERALRLAQQRKGNAGVPMKKFLVSARNDRGGVSISEERIEAILKEFGFDGYFKTSAKESWQVKELRAAIEKAIAWESLPEVASSQLFADIKSFLLEVKKTGRLLAPVNELYDEFVHQHSDTNKKVANLRDKFDTCIGRLENRDLIRRLSFGDCVLLQPELLDAYASAMVNIAKEEPDGLGSLSEEVALSGKFYVPEEQKVKDAGQEQLLQHATVEELVRHDLALRENADDGRYLVFPSQFNRDYEDAPEPKGKAVAITFEGPVQSLYSTLAVRLGHSGLFSTRRAEMWRNAAMFTAKAGGKCGIYLHEFAEAKGRLIIFYDEQASMETRFNFEEFVLSHIKHRSLDGTVELVRFFVCANGHTVPNDYVKLLIAQGKKEFNCPCGLSVLLAEPKERIHFRSKVETMDKSADRQRDFDAFVMSARGETSTKGFQEWAGGERVTLAIVFTDIVDSTALGEEIGDEAMDEVRRNHFEQSRKMIGQFQGREIKTIGDSFMVAFKCVDAALDYAIALQSNTGHPKVQIRAGIHIGPMQVEEGDVFGGTVNFAARVVGAIKDAEIWLSDRAMEDINCLGAKKFAKLNWKQHEKVEMKGFSGVFTLWSLGK